MVALGLPKRPGQITAKLKEPTRFKLMCLLNRTNAGLNDFAAVNCRLELLADDNTPLWSRDLTFGLGHVFNGSNSGGPRV